MKRASRWLLSLLALVVALGVGVAACPPVPGGAGESDGGGTFSGEVITRWDDDGDARTMRLVEPFEFTDPDGLVWSVPAGAPIDGASIPRPLWTIVGSPFVGAYRRATVIHDYYCDTKERGWRETHLVFYDAMLTSGVGSTRAKQMFAAVYNFGPRWELAPPTKGASGEPVLVVDDDRTVGRDVEAEMRELEAFIAEADPDLDALMAEIDAREDA